MDPFLSIDDFAKRFPRDLTAGETLVATDALTVATTWIVNRLPAIAQDDPAAKLVVFEVTRDTIVYGPVSRLSSFENTSLHRTESGTLSEEDVEQYITDKHCQMLGISLKAAPVANFPPARPMFPGF